MSNLTFKFPDKEKTTTAEQFYGSSTTDDNPSTGLGYERTFDRPTVTEDEMAQSDTDFKEVNTSNFDNVDMLMDGKREEEQGVITEQQVYNKTEMLHPRAPIPDDFVERVQTDVKDDKLEYNEDELATIPTWNESGRILKKFLGSTRSDETDSDFALQLGNEMFANIGGVNVSGERGRVTGGLLPLVAKVANSGDEQVINALLYTMEMYERKPMTSRGWVDGVGYMLGDASNYVGLGFVANAMRHTVGKNASTTAVKGILQQALAKIGETTAKHPVATEAVRQGAFWSATDELGREVLKARSGVRGNNEIDLTNIAGASVAGGIAGLAIVKVPEYVWKKGSKAVVDYVNRGLIKEGKGVKFFNRIAGEQSIIGDEAGSLPKEIRGSRTLNVPFDEFLDTASKKELSAYMRDATPEEKPKLIEKMKSFNVKPKSVKALEPIFAQEDFNEQFYSKLEHELSKIDDEHQFKSPDELNTLLLKQGVKPKEIEASGLLNEAHVREGFNGAYAKNYLENRPDKITKRVYDSDSVSSPMDMDEWEDSVSVNHGEHSNSSESGTATIVTDENTALDVYIEDGWSEEVYVDQDGDVIGDYNEMQEHWFENNVAESDEWYVNAKERYNEENVDAGATWDNDLEPDEQRDFVIAEASDESPWYDVYNNQQTYTIDGREFDDYDEAEKYAKEYLFEDYEYRHEEEGAEIYEDYTVSGGDNYRMNVYHMDEFESGDKDIAREPHMSDFDYGNENVQMHTRLKEREDADGNTGIVIEEVQSQWEQDWRKEGGAVTPLSTKERASLEAEMKPHMAKYEKTRKDIISIEEDKLKNINKLKDLRKEAVGDNKELLQIENSDELNELMSKIPEAVTLRDNISNLQREMNDLTTQNQEYYNRNIKYIDEKLNPDEASLATPPMQERTQYERVAILDELLQATQEGQSFFGWNNSGIQNGSRVDIDDRGREGMKNAYDLEIPRIIQKATGETPYKYYHDNVWNKSEDYKKEYWDFDRAKNLEYDERTEWYWRVDLDDKLTSKLKDGKIDLYSIGTGGLVGVGIEDEDE